MKTADLIPFILLELDDCDKYGFELTKNIETKSGGKIVIKQPTLYTLLKKLEKSKFISSYWQDSEIGGKRHYYKLTDNGRLQLATLPSYRDLLKNALNEEIDENESIEPASSVFLAPKEEKRISIMDELLNQNIAPIETVLPTHEVFADNDLDSATELDLNLANTDILKEKNISLDEQFAENTDVAKFTEKTKDIPIEIKYNETNKIDLNIEFTPPQNNLDIQYVDYVDFKKNKNNQYARKVASKKLIQVLATSATIIFILALCEFITMFTGHSTLYYCCFISSLLIAIFYPVLYATNKDKFRLKHQNITYQPKIKQKLYIGLTILFAIIILSIIVSILQGSNSIAKLLNLKNFANLYAPVLMFSAYFIDLFLNYFIVSKIQK